MKLLSRPKSMVMLRVVPAVAGLLCLCVLALAAPRHAQGDPGGGRTSPAELRPADTVSGYIARLLINETPFPGEKGWVSEEETRAAMLSIMWVLHRRTHDIPPGYRQEQVAAVQTDDIIDVITAGGKKGQCDGFHRDAAGRFVAVRRVHERVEYLLRVSRRGRPGRFARLLTHAQGLADAYGRDGILGADRFAELRRIGSIPVTGGAYSWMTDRGCYNPGGDFVRIPDKYQGSLGGNRFFTLRKLE
jgi:hypothetical protein